MSQLTCRVCGYHHPDPDPPETCPVCGSPADRFFDPDAPSHEGSETDAPPAAAKRWRCTVCGYIHEGPEPPEKCPVCGADRSKFVLMEEVVEEVSEEEPRPPLEENAMARWYRRITEKMVDLHAHPISVHIPNGVAPVAVLFVLLSALFDSPALAHAAFANMVVVLLAMPFVLFSGYNDWQRRFGGNLTHVFLGKMICGGVFTLLSLWIVVLGLATPQILAQGAGGQAFYITLHLLLLAVGGFAGYLGGKLVFPQGG